MLKWETNITPDDEGLGDDYSSYSYHGTLVDVISVAYQIVYASYIYLFTVHTTCTMYMCTIRITIV
jgi:hypothetical protein